MSGLTGSFFEYLTNAVVTKAGNPEDSSESLKRKMQAISQQTPGEAPEDYLYTDNYVIHLEKLIAPEYQEKLRQAFGDEWLTVVNSMYKRIEREVHDEMINKLSAVSFFEGEDKNG